MELELECQRHHGHAVQGSTHGDQGILLPRGLLGRAESVAVTLFVLEFQAVDGLDVREDFLPALRIEEHVEAAPGADTHVVVAFRADVLVAFHIRPVQHRVALDALFPQPFWNAAGRLVPALAAHP